MAMRFNLTDLQLMVHIGNSLSLTQGAEKSHLSVPAASTRVKNLENYFHTRLLHRTNQGVSLTPPGETLMRHACGVIAQVDQLHKDMHEFTKGIKGRIHILGNTTAMAEFIPAILGRFLASHPEVDIEVRESPSQLIVQAVSKGGADFGVVGGCPPADNVRFIPYRQENLVLVVPTHHPLTELKSVAFADTLAHDHVGLSEWSAIHSFLVTAAAERGRPFKFRAEVGSFELVCRMIEEKVGVGVIPKSIAVRYARTLGIRVLALSDSWAARKLHLCIRDLEALPSYTRELIDMFIVDASDKRINR